MASPLTLEHTQLDRAELERQLEAMQLVLTAFSLDHELSWPEPNHRQALDPDHLDTATLASLPHELRCVIHLDIDGPDAESPAQPHRLDLTVALPLTRSRAPVGVPRRLPLPRFSLHQPPWLSRVQHAALERGLRLHIHPPADVREIEGGPGDIDEDDDDDAAQRIFDAVQFLRDHAHEYLEPDELSQKAAQDAAEQDARESAKGSEYRVWYLFQSLSTREKRDDMSVAGRALTRLLMQEFEADALPDLAVASNGPLTMVSPALSS